MQVYVIDMYVDNKGECPDFSDTEHSQGSTLQAFHDGVVEHYKQQLTEDLVTSDTLINKTFQSSVVEGIIIKWKLQLQATRFFVNVFTGCH